MNNFYDITILEKTKKFDTLKCIDIAEQDWNLFMNNLSDTNKKKFKIVNNLSLIKTHKYLITFCEGHESIPSPSHKISIPQHSKDFSKNKILKYVKCLFDQSDANVNNLSFFNKTLSFIETNLPFSNHIWYMFFKDGAQLVDQKEVGWELYYKNNVTIYILMNDIEGGDFRVTIEKEVKTVSKKGEVIIFKSEALHSIAFTGSRAWFLLITADI